MGKFEKCTVAMLGGPCSQHVTGNTSRLNQPQSAIMYILLCSMTVFFFIPHDSLQTTTSIMKWHYFQKVFFHLAPIFFLNYALAAVTLLQATASLRSDSIVVAPIRQIISSESGESHVSIKSLNYLVHVSSGESSHNSISNLETFPYHRECREPFPHHRLQRKSLVSDPSMHHGRCITHVS